MKNKPKLDLGLNAYEELFTHDVVRVEARLPKIYDIPIELIGDFPEHPFKVRVDEDMEQLIASIKEQDLITPVILRPKGKGRYEMVSSHRRKEACLWVGLKRIKVEVREMTYDEAIIIMVDSNLQRSVILPNEKAFSYKMRLEAIKRQEKHTDLTSSTVGMRSNQQVGKDTGDSARQVARYVRLTEPVPDLLDLVDDDKVSFRPAVEFSYLAPEEQVTVCEQIMYNECLPSHAQAIRMRKLSKDGLLTDATIKRL